MYSPPAFRMTEHDDMAAFIATRRFATLVISASTGPMAAHIPMIYHRETGILEGHVARGNPIATSAASGVRALAIFHGADAYVTPAWYPAKQEHGKVVPTWNYIAVEVAGRLETFSDAPSLHAQIEALTDMMEQGAPAPWAVSDAPADYIEKMLNAITGLRLHVDAIEGKRKLSQNRPEADRAGVLDGFAHSTDPAAQKLANEMTKEARK